MFSLGDKVSFISNSNMPLVGVIVKVNPETYKINIGSEDKPEYRWVTKRKKKHKVELVR